MTYIDDIVDGIIGALHRKTKKHRIYNLGNQTPIELLEMVSILEELTQIKGNYKHLPMQVGDIHETYADITAASRDLGYKPHTTLSEGLNKFVEWYKVYYL